MTRSTARRAAAAAVAVAALAVAGQAEAQAKGTKKPAPAVKGVAPVAPKVSLPAPEILVGMEKLIETRTGGSFDGTSVYLSMAGKDATGIKAARAVVRKATDDLGNDLSGSHRSRGDDFAFAREGQPPLVTLELGLAPRKATKLSATATLEVFLPERDPAGRVDVADFKGKRDKPLSVPALKAQKVELTLYTKAGLEAAKAKVEAEEKAKQKAKAKGGKKKAEDGLEQMAESIGSAMASMIENLLFSVAEQDVALRVKDPDGRIFTFEVLGPDGKPLRSYGVLGSDSEFRVIKMGGPVPDGSTLRVFLKSPATLVEVPFTLADVVLP